jgi:hypothetical protein
MTGMNLPDDQPDAAVVRVSPSKEARDTVAGCRDRAAQDRLQAGSAGTENGRHVLERSAASWDVRGDDIQENDDASAQQRTADRDLWARGEADDASRSDKAEDGAAPIAPTPTREPM